MSYQIGGDGLLDFSLCASDEEKMNQCWEYFLEHLSNTRVVAFDGCLVRGFTRVSFTHIVSGSSNNYDPSLGHDIPFVEQRARCLPLIGKVIRGEIPSRAYTEIRRGKTRRVLAVIEYQGMSYVVVMDVVGDQYRIRTAFPPDVTYIERCIVEKSEYVGEWKL